MLYSVSNFLILSTRGILFILLPYENSINITFPPNFILLFYPVIYFLICPKIYENGCKRIFDLKYIPFFVKYIICFQVVYIENRQKK